MKLLFDANLAPDLARRLEDVFPGSRHVFTCGEIAHDDLLVWDFARQNGFAIVSKDSDFHRMSFVLGAPPKVVWLRIGNASTAVIEAALRGSAAAIERFDGAVGVTFLTVGR